MHICQGTTCYGFFPIFFPFFPFYFCSIYCIVKFEDRRTSFKCFVFDGQNVLMLEKELTYLGGMCSAALMRRDISLPPGEVPATHSLAHSLTHPLIHTLSVYIYTPLPPSHPPPLLYHIQLTVCGCLWALWGLRIVRVEGNVVITHDKCWLMLTGNYLLSNYC